VPRLLQCPCPTVPQQSGGPYRQPTPPLNLKASSSSSTLSQSTPKGDRSILRIFCPKNHFDPSIDRSLAHMQAYMEGGQLGACLPSFLVPDHYAFPLPLPLQLPSQPNKLLQMPFDQEEAENHGVMLSSDHCGLYQLPALPLGCGSGAASAACGGKPTAGLMPSTIGADEVR
jgi:hypothetical protein